MIRWYVCIPAQLSTDQYTYLSLSLSLSLSLRFPLSGTPNNLFTFSVTMEIREEDGKGNFVAVPRDRDLFKFRVNAQKKIVVAVTQTTNRDLVVERLETDLD